MLFKFKQFSIEDNNCAMKIGTDGCLLGAWADVCDAQNILDIGTGSGVIALMLAQRSNAMIDAIEIDNDAYKQACENFANSPWKIRLQVIHSSLQEYVKTCTKKYDLIVSSPPYFLNSLPPLDRKRKLARHTDSLSFEELLSCTLRLLNKNGKFCVVIPSDIVSAFCNIALIEGFFTTLTTHTEPKAGAKPLRTLLQMERSKKTRLLNTIAILDNEGKSYTPDYINLTKDFYINF
jgi:tRNA1Val (adenine37-N6)-methyltransferase